MNGGFAVRVHIKYGDSFDALHTSRVTWSHTEALECVLAAVAKGQAPAGIYLIAAAPSRLTDEARECLERLRLRKREGGIREQSHSD